MIKIVLGLFLSFFIGIILTQLFFYYQLTSLEKKSYSTNMSTIQNTQNVIGTRPNQKSGSVFEQNGIIGRMNVKGDNQSLVIVDENGEKIIELVALDGLILLSKSGNKLRITDLNTGDEVLLRHISFDDGSMNDELILIKK